MQTGAMKALFERYPEVLLIDGTHCVNNRRMPLYSLMVMDNNGRGRIVRYALVNSETVAIITKVMEMFKAANPKSSDLRAVLLDKDCSEIACMQHVFPGAHIVICKFHVLKTFRSAVARLVQGGEAKEKVPKILETLVCGNDFEMHPTPVWLPIKNMWATNLYKDVGCSGNETIDRLEHHNAVIKQVVTCKSL